MPEITPEKWAEMAARSPDDFDADEDATPEEDFVLPRKTGEVVDAHLTARKQHRVEEDLSNFSPDVLILSSTGVYRGHDGLQRFWRELDDAVPSARFAYAEPRSDGEAAMVEWQARGRDTYVDDGVDSYLVRDGRIIIQTVHYTIRRPA